MTFTERTNGQMVAASAAQALGVQLSPSGAENVAALLDTFATFSAEGVHVDGLPALDYVQNQIAANPAWKSSPAAPRIPNAVQQNRTEAAKAKIAALRSPDQRAENAKKATEAGNPWKPGPTFNRSKQGIVANNNPQLAEQLRTEVAL